MPRRPDWSQHEPNPRFAPYRDRVAHVTRDGERVGLLLVRVEPYATLEGGFLWWRRWTSHDALWLWMTVDGRFEDDFVHADRVEGELRDWSRGLFRYRGEVLRLEWLSSEKSQQLRRSGFGRE